MAVPDDLRLLLHDTGLIEDASINRNEGLVVFSVIRP